ncbi:MAG: hypothetical protein ISS59_02870 [Desulfobacteraceae bacterium]|nr:hypothetical protein [Desulfobacteraceae bacterium]
MKRIKGRRDDTDRNQMALPSSSDLRGRQSVRATFKLTENAINTMSVVAAHLGIRQKSLFDHLIEDRRSLGLMASGVQPERFSRLKRIQKTYVISRKTLCCLNDASKDLDASRDALVEYSIQRLLPLIEEERERHRKRKEILDEMTEYLEQGEGILGKSRKLLGEDDPVHEKLGAAMRACRKAHNAVVSFVEKGKIIDAF